jgi:hypothetical protein
VNDDVGVRGEAAVGVDVLTGTAAVGVEVGCSVGDIQPASKRPIRMKCENFTMFLLF